MQSVTATENRWDSQKVEIPVKSKGLYLVEVVNGDMRAYTILVVSDIVMLTKNGRTHLLYYVADRTSGEPLPNVSVTTMERNGAGVSAHTNADGLVDYPISKTPSDDLRTVAIRGADVAFGDLGNWSFTRQRRELTGLVYTDRPIYRPGDTTHFRAILRNREAIGYSVPENETLSVQITDQNGKPIYQKDLTTNRNGILHDEITLGKDAGLGDYYITVRSGESTANGSFQVQEYKKPEYEVHVTPEARRILQGRSTSVTIDSRYYFGEPVASAKVKYSIYESRYWFPLWYDNADEGGENGGPEEPNDYGQNTEIKQAEGTLNADGKLTIDLASQVSPQKADSLYRIEAGVTDKAGREISGTGYVVATYGEFLINVQPDRWFYQPSDLGRFKVETRNYDNQAVSAPVHLEIRSYDPRRRQWGPELSSADVTSDATGTATGELRLPAKGGSYRLLATAPSAGRKLQSETYLWVSGESADWGANEGVQSLTIVPDKKTYKPGDTAHIMIATGRNNAALLVTMEGRDIRSHALLHPKNGSAVFDYQVTSADEPGFFVSAQMVCSGVLHSGDKLVKVPPDDHRLDVKLATDKPRYQPGSMGTYDIAVTMADGKPAANADLSLGVVDEAIYAIAKDTTPDPLQAFYGREYNTVNTESSLTYFFTGEAGTRRMQLAALRPKTRLAQLKPEQLVQPKIRKYFPDTTFWADDLTTDSAGHVKAKVAFPDSLTTWRATARASSPDDRYGAGLLKTVVRKNLILRLAVPRFFIQGDEVVISAIAHNYLTAEKQAHISVKLEGLDILSGAVTQVVSIGQRGEAKVDWRVKARQLGKAKITVEALTDEESDALELSLPVEPPGVLIRDARSGAITEDHSAKLSFTYPQTALPGSRSLSIRLSPSVAGSIFNALEYLTSFPYGCVEQTMSSFIPDVVVTTAMRDLKLQQPIDQKALDEKIHAGLERLYNYHHEDGGWGWWASDDSHPFMTAYVVAGLAQARAAGINVDESAVAKGVAWIKLYLAQHKHLAGDLHAYLLYALAESGNQDAADESLLYSQRSSLSPYGLSFLGLAFEHSKDNRAGALAAELESSAKVTDSEASWPSSRDEMLDFSTDVTPETTAFAVKLISRQHPQSPLLPKAALWLVSHRDEGYWWSSTKQTAMVIYGLIDYVKASGELHPDIQAVVRINGQQVNSTSFTNGSLAAAPTLTVEDSRLSAGVNQLEIEAKGKGRIYYAISADHHSTEPKAQNVGSINLNILRDYYRMQPADSKDGIVYDLKPLNGPVAAGDVLAVRLTVTGSDWRYLMVEDPIPAGAEFIKDDNLYHLQSAPPWWQYFFTQRENHDDRVAIFDEYFNDRQTQYFYLLKVVNPGLFQINPARVEPMYQPGYQATTAAATLEVK